MTLKHNWLKGRLLWSAFRFCPDSRAKLPRLPFLLLEPLEGRGVLARASPWRLQWTLRLTLRPITGSPPRQIRFLEGWRQALHVRNCTRRGKMCLFAILSGQPLVLKEEKLPLEEHLRKPLFKKRISSVFSFHFCFCSCPHSIIVF